MKVKTILIPINRKPVDGDIIKDISRFAKGDEYHFINKIEKDIAIGNKYWFVYNGVEQWLSDSTEEINDTVQSQQLIVVSDEKFIYPKDGDYYYHGETNHLCVAGTGNCHSLDAKNIIVAYPDLKGVNQFLPEFIKEFVIAGCPESINLSETFDVDLNELTIHVNSSNINSNGFVVASLIKEEKSATNIFELCNNLTESLPDAEHEPQPGILTAFIKAVRDEFHDENWDYLDFIADRVIKQQLQSEVKTVEDKLLKAEHFIDSKNLPITNNATRIFWAEMLAEYSSRRPVISDKAIFNASQIFELNDIELNINEGINEITASFIAGANWHKNKIK